MELDEVRQTVGRQCDSNMKVLSPDAVDHICSRFWEATGEQTESRYTIVKLFVKSVQDMKVINLDEDVEAADERQFW